MRSEGVVGVKGNAKDFGGLFQRYDGGGCFDFRMERGLVEIRGVEGDGGFIGGKRHSIFLTPR